MTADEVIDGVLAREGAFIDDPIDRGGATNRGITAQTLAVWRHQPVTLADIQALTEAEARDIYRHMYVEAPGYAEAIPDGRLLALVVDFAVLSGSRTATKALQRALGVVDDGAMGAQTRRVLQAPAGVCRPGRGVRGAHAGTVDAA